MGTSVPEIVLLFVVETPPAGLYQSRKEGQEKLMDWATDYITRIENILLAENVKVEGLVLLGKPAETIVDFASKDQIDLIMMSAHGWSRLNRWALGSVVDKVTRASPVSVLIVIPEVD